MTKYILNSGNVKSYPDKLRNYNKEVFRSFSERKDDTPIKVLMCFFAMPRERWEEKFEVYKNNLKNDVPQELEIKMAEPQDFEKQCEWTDLIFVSGGDDELLVYRFSKFDIPNIWDGKVVTTSSAGSDYLVKHFWTCDWRDVMDGSGILPIKFIPHYKSDYGSDDPRGKIDWEKAYKKLENYGDKNIQIYALEEGDFAVFEV